MRGNILHKLILQEMHESTDSRKNQAAESSLSKEDGVERRPEPALEYVCQSKKEAQYAWPRDPWVILNQHFYFVAVMSFPHAGPEERKPKPHLPSFSGLFQVTGWVFVLVMAPRQHSGIVWSLEFWWFINLVSLVSEDVGYGWLGRSLGATETIDQQWYPQWKLEQMEQLVAVDQLFMNCQVPC